ncbi:hypothetical protein OROMI_028658 [Orobanche minor]
MPTSQPPSAATPNSQSIPDENSQPSTTLELQIQSTPTGISIHEPDVITITDECNYCSAKLRGDSGAGTSHLNSHYETKHHSKGQTSITQTLLASNFNKDNPKLASTNFCHDGAKKELANMIIMHEYPLSMVDHVGFKRYSSYLQPLFKVPCRNTIKNEIFQIYEVEKVKTLSLLESNVSRVAITTDMWTASNQKKGYMAITAHFIDSLWVLQSRIMRFIYVPCPHTKEVLCDNLLECLMDWNLDRKLSCLTVDNCSTNDAMVGIMLEKLDSSSLVAAGDLFHMRCAAHILNLIVKDGLDVMKVGLEKIRDSVAYWTATPKREEKFEETARQLRNISTKKLGLDCATRWNSTYLMLETALLYKDVFTRLGQREPQYKAYPSREEWDFAQDVCRRLELFFKATEIFSVTKYRTANQCFVNICEVRLAITDWCISSNIMIQTMAEKILTKFEKYWDIMHGVVGVAAVLDPRYKLEVLEFYFEKIDGETSRVKVENVRDRCYSLLKEYHEKKLANGHEGIELDHYLDEDVVQKDGFDLLNWWKANEQKYPTLQRMARHFLAIPASTVASESAFSSSGRLVSPHRNRLHPKTLEALMCAQSWLWVAEMKGQASTGYATIYQDQESEDSCITRMKKESTYGLLVVAKSKDVSRIVFDGIAAC